MEAHGVLIELHMESNRVIRGDYWKSTGARRGIVILCHGFRAHKDALMMPYISQ